MELINVFRILRRWSWVIIACVLLTGSALLLGLSLSKPLYETQVKIQLSTPQQEDVAVYDQYRSVNLRDMITVARNNFVSTLESEEVRNRTSLELNIDLTAIEYELEVKSNEDSDFVYVTVRAPSPALAALIANTLVDRAADYYGELRARPTIEEKELYAEQLEASEAVYRSAANAFTTFKAENSIVVLSEEIKTEQRLLEQLQAERDQRILQYDVTEAIDRIRELISKHQTELDRLQQLEPAYSILDDNYQESRDVYRRAVSLNLGDAERAAAEQRYRKAELAFNEFKIQNKVNTLQSDMDLNNDALKQLQFELDQRLLADANKEGVITQVDKLILLHKQELDRLSSLQPTYNVLERKANEAQEKYQHVLTKYSEAELKATVVRAANFIQIIESAHEPMEPINNFTKLFILGIMGSLGVGVILAFLLDYLTAAGGADFVTDKFDSRSIFGLPVLGMIPVLKSPVYRGNTQEAENIRQLRANILLSPSGDSLKTLLIASPQPGDGKTFTAANLGAAMTDGKSRIVLVDADLRNPTLHEVFDQPNLGGMADLLSADERALAHLIPQYLRNTDIPGLLLLSAGKLPEDPPFLFSSRNMKLILEELSRTFDFVIIDSPPFNAAPDAAILSEFADGTLFVVYPGKTRMRTAEEAVHSFTSNGANIVGVALNHIPLDQHVHPYQPHRETKPGLLERTSLFLSSLKTPLNKKPVDPDLITMEDAARMLGVRRKTISHWCKVGELHAKRIHWRWWVKRGELQNFIRNRFGVEVPLDQ